MLVAILWRSKRGDVAAKVGGKTRNAAKSKGAPVRSLLPYRATSIAFKSNACDAVRAMGEQCFLVSEGNTPLLPLPGCDAERCDCKYVHRDDRRVPDGPRRHPGSGLQAEIYDNSGNPERRQKRRGRRKEDWD